MVTRPPSTWLVGPPQAAGPWPRRYRCSHLARQAPSSPRLNTSGTAVRDVPYSADFIRTVRASNGWPACSPSRVMKPKNDSSTSPNPSPA